MTQLVEQELKLEERKEKSVVKKIFKWIGSNLKFLFIPGYRIEELTIREQEYERTISKRKFIRRLKSVLTIIGIGIIFMIVTFAVFAPWISPYSFDVADDVWPGVFDPPSTINLLGKTGFGRGCSCTYDMGSKVFVNNRTTRYIIKCFSRSYLRNDICIFWRLD